MCMHAYNPADDTVLDLQGDYDPTPTQPEDDGADYAMGNELDMERLAAEQAQPRPMMPGDTLTVLGGLLVEKLRDAEWAVRTPHGDWAGVSEDPEGDGGYLGYLGEQRAVAAVLQAEQMFDRGDAQAANQVNAYADGHWKAIPF